MNGYKNPWRPSRLACVFILRILPALWNTKSIPLGRLFVYPMKCLFLFYFIGAAINLAGLRKIAPVPILEKWTKMGLVANKLIPIDAVVRDVPSLDTARHNMEKTR